MGRQLAHRPVDEVAGHRDRIGLQAVDALDDAFQIRPLDRGPDVDVADLGVALRPLNTEEKQQLSLDHGLVVTAIRSGKMQDAGISKGIIIMQVNDKQMRSQEDFEAAVKDANMSNDRVLWIRAKTQSGLNKSFTVELSDPKEKAKKK